MKRLPCLILACLAIGLAGPSALAMRDAGRDASLVDPPVILSNTSDRTLIVTWQTSIPGVAASPVEEIVLAAGARNEHINHANVWVTEDSDSSGPRSVTNQIEVWVHAQEAPDVVLSHFVTYRELYAADFADLDKSVVLEIVLSPTVGIDVFLDTGL